MKTYTEDQVFTEKKKSFADGQLHRTPSPETARSLNSINDKFDKFMDKFEEVPITLALIQKDIALNAGLSKRVSKLEAWRTGLAMVLGAAMFVVGYFVSIIQTNLELRMEKTAQTIVDKELSKYNISYEKN